MPDFSHALKFIQPDGYVPRRAASRLDKAQRAFLSSCGLPNGDALKLHQTVLTASMDCTPLPEWRGGSFSFEFAVYASPGLSEDREQRLIVQAAAVYDRSNR